MAEVEGLESSTGGNRVEGMTQHYQGGHAI